MTRAPRGLLVTYGQRDGEEDHGEEEELEGLGDDSEEGEGA